MMKKLQTLYQAMLMGQVLFAGVAIFIKQQSIITNVTKDISQILEVVALLVSFGSVWAGMSLYRKRIAALKETPGEVAKKINNYTATSIIKWAMTEGPYVFCIIGYLLTGNWAFLGLAAVLLFVFAGYAPQKSKVIAELGLTEEESSKL
jgi:hypothetical protein